MLAQFLVLASANPMLQDYCAIPFEDITFKIKFVQGNRVELRKINQDFANAYEQTEAAVFYKEPMKFCLESQMNGQKATYIVSGDYSYWKIPRLGINSKINISKSPGKRQSMFDFGIVTLSMLKDYVVGTFVNQDNELVVFDLRYQYELDKSRHRIWIKKENRYITKREWYGQTGNLTAVFHYLNPVRFQNIWMPTRCEVHNSEGKLAGITEYQSFVLNSGLSDEKFKN